MAPERPADLTHTVATYRGYIDRSIRPTLGKLSARPAGRRHPGRLLRPLRTQGGKGGRPMAASSVHQVHAILSGALNRAAVCGLDQPATRPGSPRPLDRTGRPAARRRSRTPPACSAFALAEDPSWAVPAPGGGARRPPGRAVRGSLVGRRPGPGRGPDRGRDRARPGESLVDKATKTHAKRRVAVGADTVELLRAHRLARPRTPSPAGPAGRRRLRVLARPDGSAPINPDGITPPLSPPRRRLGVRCRLHDLRHFMVTQLVAGGVDWRTGRRPGRARRRPHDPSTYAHFQQACSRTGQGGAEFSE
jgi:hypothetical protein